MTSWIIIWQFLLAGACQTTVLFLDRRRFRRLARLVEASWKKCVLYTTIDASSAVFSGQRSGEQFALASLGHHSRASRINKLAPCDSLGIWCFFSEINTVIGPCVYIALCLHACHCQRYKRPKTTKYVCPYSQARRRALYLLPRSPRIQASSPPSNFPSTTA